MFVVHVNDSEVTAMLKNMARRVGDMSPAMSDIGMELAHGSRQTVERGTDWEGRTFAPNSPATLLRKSGSRPLVDRGDMVGSRIFHEHDSRSATVGVSAIQSAVLQFGAKRGQFGRTRRGAPIPWGNIPARQFMPIGPGGQLPASARKWVMDIIRKHVMEGS